ncbi:large terminase [Blastococcus sp. CCUG 61487]|uniref:large terminase n=1 Tax=Blastococcus sp. CCUG 61487 TaxID=1840703 RepID=UPI0010C08FB4|nr:large terminase [Blastococcus sp. CCUG 61487]TKJ25231.1 large terminase [Blastococcus sp. CCUG 61487]
MTLLLVPELEEEPWPTLGPQIADFLEERSIFGPGSLQGQPYVLDAEKRAALYRAYEVYPQGHVWAGRRRFKRVGISWRKGLAKTEFGAEIVYAELHAEGPVRCDGFDAYGQPVGRPVKSPYIPMLAVTVEQVEELAFGALYYICTEGPDADYFDSTLERIVRIDERGRADGRAVPLANSPGSRDGARTTFQLFDEPHRLHLPRQVDAHETMVANLEKRVLEDPWGMYVGTAGEPGQGSVAEGLHREAQLIAAGKIDEPRLFYFHRQARDGLNLENFDERLDAVAEATGPVGEYGPGQFHSIAAQWDRPGADKAYLERVWLNRWTRSGAQAFDLKRFEALGPERDVDGNPVEERTIAPGSFITLGFDGARFKDATALVATDIPTGLQMPLGLWERPENAHDGWEVPEDEVDDVLEDAMRRFKVWKLYADPPHWVETVGKWAGKYPDQVVEWWTFHRRPMGMAIRAYQEAIDSGALSHTGDPDLIRHVGNAGKKKTNLVDDEGKTIFILTKISEERKFDAAMAAVLSWRARLDALSAGAKPPRSSSGFYVPYRVR